jgi:hypothetical protein
VRDGSLKSRPYFIERSDLVEDGTECSQSGVPIFAGTNNTSGCGMTNESESSFAVVRFNERTYQPGGVVAVIKGIKVAQKTLDDFDSTSAARSSRGLSALQ